MGSNGRTNVAPSELTDPLALEESAVAFVHAALARATAVSSHVQRQRRMGVAEAKNRYAADYAQRVHEVIAQRFHEPVTLNLIATEVGCSPYHLSRLVMAHEAVSIYNLVLKLRLRAALDRVLGSADSLSAVALDSGFASQSHFGDAFRREFGAAPGVLRRRCRMTPRTLIHRRMPPRPTQAPCREAAVHEGRDGSSVAPQQSAHAGIRPCSVPHKR